MNNRVVGIERIIAKIDNDFNLDNSDWVPRIGAWCYDAMAQLDVLNKVTKTKTLPVNNRIAYNPCGFTDDGLEIYDENGCKIDRVSEGHAGCFCPSITGELSDDQNGNNGDGSNLREYVPSDGHRYGIEPPYGINQPDADCDVNGAKTLERGDDVHMYYETTAYHINNHMPNSHDVRIVRYPPRGKGNFEKNYNLIDKCRIGLNFDTSKITIKNKEIETIYSDVYKCELPSIPDNGLLIEALGFYCIYKILCRGYKHPVFNLSASQYGTNPYYEWMRLKDKAKTSVLNDKIDMDKATFKYYFWDSTFH